MNASQTSPVRDALLGFEPGLVSVIMPGFNAQAFVAQAVESVQGQNRLRDIAACEAGKSTNKIALTRLRDSIVGPANFASELN
jgi:hypothetical protein